MASSSPSSVSVNSLDCDRAGAEFVCQGSDAVQAPREQRDAIAVARQRACGRLADAEEAPVMTATRPGVFSAFTIMVSFSEVRRG